MIQIIKNEIGQKLVKKKSHEFGKAAQVKWKNISLGSKCCN
jgi:hypothetical protein